MSRSRTLLVTGFGPFPGVSDNPSGRLALQIDGMEVGPYALVGRVLPVSYARAPLETAFWAREVGAELVVGTGVSPSGPIRVEQFARRQCDLRRVDVDGRLGALEGPIQVAATGLCERLADALGAALSTDAGSYVCNAWLYTAALGLDVPVLFVHLPPEGVDAQRFAEGLGAL